MAALFRRFVGRAFRRAFGRAQFDGLVAPDLFQAVVSADRRLHDVHDHVAQVDQYPFPGVLAFHADDVAAIVLDLVAHRGGQRLGLAIRGAGDDDDAVEQAGQVSGVVQDDVLALDVFEGVNDEGLQFFDVHLAFVKIMLLNIV